MIKGERQLEMLAETIKACAANQPDILDLLNPLGLAKLNESLKEDDNDMGLANEKFMKIVKQW